MEKRKKQFLEKKLNNKEKFIRALGEEKYAQRLGNHVAMLLNKGFVCRNFQYNEAYGDFEQDKILYRNLKSIISKFDEKINEIDFKCSYLKKANPIINEYLDLDEQLYFLEGTIKDEETKNIAEEKKNAIKNKMNEVIKEDKKVNNVIEKFLNLRDEQSKFYFEVDNMQNKFENQFYYIGSIVADMQSKMQEEGKSVEEQNKVIDAYVDGFFQNLDFEKFAEALGMNKTGVENNFKRLLLTEDKDGKKVDRAKIIATDRYGSRNEKINSNIYQANEKYNSFYNTLAAISKDVFEKSKNNKSAEITNENPEEINRKMQGMKVIKLSEIENGKDFFHFTREKAIPKIVARGLRGDLETRENAVDRDYENPSVYFSKGEIGVLKTVDVWLRWEYGRITRSNKYPDGSVITVPDALKKTFEKTFDDFKERRYFQLDLVEGKDRATSDFSYESDDFKKKGAINRGGPDRRTKWMLGSYTNWQTPRLEDWNMMTHIGGKPIEFDRMKMITTEEGKSDALSVIEEIYERAREKTNVDVRYLDSFIKYAEERTLQQEKNATKNIGKSVKKEFSQVEGTNKITELIKNETRRLNQKSEIEQK